MNLFEIAKAWVISFNPSKEQQELADERVKVCDSCEFKKFSSTLWIFYCSACGCPLDKKIFSPENSCPKEKWKK